MCTSSNDTVSMTTSTSVRLIDLGSLGRILSSCSRLRPLLGLPGGRTPRARWARQFFIARVRASFPSRRSALLLGVAAMAAGCLPRRRSVCSGGRPRLTVRGKRCGGSRVAPWSPATNRPIVDAVDGVLVLPAVPFADHHCPTAVGSRNVDGARRSAGRDPALGAGRALFLPRSRRCTRLARLGGRGTCPLHADHARRRVRGGVGSRPPLSLVGCRGGCRRSLEQQSPIASMALLVASSRVLPKVGRSNAAIVANDDGLDVSFCLLIAALASVAHPALSGRHLVGSERRVTRSYILHWPVWRPLRRSVAHRPPPAWTLHHLVRALPRRDHRLSLPPAFAISNTGAPSNHAVVARADQRRPPPPRPR